MIALKIVGTAVVLVLFGGLALWLYVCWIDFSADYKGKP